MSTSKEAAKFLKNAVKDLSGSVCENALTRYTGQIDVNPSVKIPFELLSTSKTKDIMPYVKEFRLDDPENMINFLIELHFSCFDSVNDGIGSIRGDLLDTTISAIESVKKLLKYAEKNPSEKEEKLSECISKLSDAQSDLEMKIRRYVNEIEKVDNRTGMAFFVRAKVDIGKVDANVELATAALRSYIEAANLLAFIGVKKGVDVETFLDSTERYIESLRDNKSISLMAAYDKMKDDTYWNSSNILNSVDGIRTISDELIELIEDSDDEVDLENDIVF